MSYYVTNENSVLNINNAHLKVSGNIQTDVMKLGAIEFAPPASDVAGTVNFTNVTTGATTSSNLNVGGTLMLGTVEVVSTTHTLENTTTNGNITPHTVEFTNPTTSIVASGNVEVEKELTVTGNVAVSGIVGSSGTGALTIPRGTTAEQPSTGLVGGMIRFNSTTNRLEVYNGTEWQGLGGVSATQSAGSGTTTTAGGYKIHTFTSSGDLVVNSGGEVDYLIVAGGGGGATTDGGGGGAGGVVYGTMSVQTIAYGITIGTGGAFVNTNDRAGLSGNDSTALGFTALGGGGGGNDRVGGQGPKTGGSGGGGGSRQSQGQWLGASGLQNSTKGYGVGNNGGHGVNSPSIRAGGGGGAGEDGKNGNDGSRPAGGGNGIQWPSGSVLYYGGGGGGGHNVNGTGGQGGGGQGSTSTTSPSTAGTPNTGGGGGGGGGAHSRGSSGGSGIVILRYLL